MKIVAEYIWIDGQKPTKKLRSKTKVFTKHLNKASDIELNDFPEWGFDGSSTGQAEGKFSDCILKPVKFVKNPIANHKSSFLVMCEVYTEGDSQVVPHTTNTRHKLAALENKYKDDECWFGIEQEYTMYKDNKPLGFPGYNFKPAAQGGYYCGVGADETFGSQIVEEHMYACINAGLEISGTNAEVMPGQWGYQIGPCSPLEASDSIWLARFLLYKIAAKYDVVVKLDPKPVTGDWNGAGAHTNFSTKKMREDGGIKECEMVCEKFGLRTEQHLEVYGDGIEHRLTGKHETCRYDRFKYGVGDRTASLRIPLHVSQKGKGYIEDRRPNANMDPYEVTAIMIETALDYLFPVKVGGRI